MAKEKAGRAIIAREKVGMGYYGQGEGFQWLSWPIIRCIVGGQFRPRKCCTGQLRPSTSWNRTIMAQDKLEQDYYGPG